MQFTIDKATKNEQELLLDKISTLYLNRGKHEAQSIGRLFDYAESITELRLSAGCVLRFEDGIAYTSGKPSTFSTTNSYVLIGDDLYRISLGSDNSNEKVQVWGIQKNGFDDTKEIVILASEIAMFIEKNWG